MNTKEKINSLNVKSVWSYTKQKANFNDLFLSAKLFSEIPNVANTRVEDYFSNNFSKYGISTYRHRILAIAQMFGLISKTPYFGRSSYSNETTTPVFESLKHASPGSVEFNKIMSEQLLKLRIKAITDNQNYRDDYYIYPFIFLFLVMWNLESKHSIKQVETDKIWTYVLTCKSMKEIDDAVSWILDPLAKVSPFLKQYKSDSRIMTLILTNTKMFSLVDNKLSLNHPIADKFYEQFIAMHNLNAFETYLHNDTKYKKFLENIQGFDFDLTSNPTGIVKRSYTKKAIFKKDSNSYGSSSKHVSILVPSKDNPEIDNIIDAILDLQDEQEVKEASIYDNEDDINKSNNRAPVLKNGLETNKRYSTDARLAKTAIKNAGYVCELCGKIKGSHSTFDSTHGTPYLEAHHLIPMKAQKDFISLGVNLDRLENIVALCPNCHKAVHYGTYAEKVRFLKPLYDARIGTLKGLGIDIDFDILIDEYYK